jgi:hypothetical protein
MKTPFTCIALAAMLAIGASFAAHAEDAAKPAEPAAAKADAPVNVPRPSIAPKTAEPAAAPAPTDATPRRHRRYARHHYRRYAYWEPFPVYLPHVHRHRIYWNRTPWFFF